MNNDTPKVITPLGHALHNARLTASLSVQEVARRLNLKESAVVELEGDISALIESGKYAPIYLRGYLANYAKLVALKSLNEFVEYQQLAKPQEKKISIKATSSRSLAAQKKLLPLYFVIILLLIAALVVVAKQLDFFAEEKPLGSSDAVPETSVNSENKVTEPMVINKITLSELENITSVEVVEEFETVEAIDEAEEITDEEVLASLSEQHRNAKQITDGNDKSVDLENAKSEQLALQQAPKPESLMLSFSGDCWTEISDATGKRLAFGLYKEDVILSLEGIAPFKIKLGDPSAVAIKYQNQKIEHTVTAGRIAQFYIPE